MSTFVDTSGFIALMVAEDVNHARAGAAWGVLVQQDELLITSNYVVVEMCAILQRRSGMSAVRTFLNDILPATTVEWVDAGIHNAAAAGLLMGGRNGPNIVDCVSFALMRRLGIRRALAFDGHFQDQGFRQADEKE